MADISAELVKELRERTGAGFMDCKRALTDADGDLDKAAAHPARARASPRPRRRPTATPARASSRATSTPAAASACSSRSTARPTSSPAPTSSRSSSATSRSRSPASRRCTSTRSASRPTILAAKQAELLADESVQKKPENIRPQIVEGQLKKWYSQVCLLDQPFRDEERTVRELITEKIATIGENIRVRRFTRYALGEEM